MCPGSEDCNKVAIKWQYLRNKTNVFSAIKVYDLFKWFLEMFNQNVKQVGPRSKF